MKIKRDCVPLVCEQNWGARHNPACREDIKEMECIPIMPSAGLSAPNGQTASLPGESGRFTGTFSGLGRAFPHAPILV